MLGIELTWCCHISVRDKLACRHSKTSKTVCKEIIIRRRERKKVNQSCSWSIASIGHIIYWMAMNVLLTQLVIVVAWWTWQSTVNRWFAAQVTCVGWVVKVKRPAYEWSFQPARRCTGFWGRVIHHFVIASRYIGLVSQRVFPLRGCNWKILKAND